MTINLQIFSLDGQWLSSHERLCRMLLVIDIVRCVRSTFVDIFLERKVCVCIDKFTSRLYKQVHTAYKNRDRSKTGKTALRRTDCYILKLRRKYSCYR